MPGTNNEGLRYVSQLWYFVRTNELVDGIEDRFNEQDFVNETNEDNLGLLCKQITFGLLHEPLHLVHSEYPGMLLRESCNA